MNGTVGMAYVAVANMFGAARGYFLLGINH